MSAKAKQQTKKTQAASAKPRMLKKPTYKSFRVHKTIKPHQTKIISSFKILKKSILTIKNLPKLFLGIIGIYLLLSLVFVKGFATSLDIPSLKESLNSILGGFNGKALGTFALFGVLVGSSGASKTTDGSSVYQAFIIISTSLAILWAHRQNSPGKIKVRDSFYKGMYPFVPVVLVLIVISLQLLPIGIGSWLYAAAIQGGIAVTALEKIVWAILIFLLFLLSLYMISSSFFALIIASLPDVAPMQALRSARALVIHRRWMVIRKLMYLLFVTLIFSALIMLPFLVWLPIIAEWVFFIISGLGLLLGVSYCYVLYKELLNE